jgi:hypothetical protein
MLFVDPTAVMHWPTFSADEWTASAFRYVVVAVVVTVTLVLVPAAELPAAGLLPCTTKPPADSEVTLPLAPPNPPLPNGPLVPLGRGLGLKLGFGEKLPPGPPSPPPPNPAPPNPLVQLPLTGVLMVTVVAVTVLVAAPPADGWPTTVTQLPTVRSADFADTVSVIAVEAVKVTVTCPLVGFCTSMLDPDTAAAVPTTPGKAAWLLADAELLLATEGVAVAPAPPQAVAASATIPRPAREGIQRRRRDRRRADGRLVVTPIMVGSHPCGWHSRRGCSSAARLLFLSLRSAHSLRSASMGASRAARVAG